MANSPIGVTFNAVPGQSSTPVMIDAGGIDVFEIDGPYLTDAGTLQSPLPVVLVDGPTNQSVLLINLPDDE